jgi:hypothetical protein
MFAIITFPDGFVALDSGNVQAGGVFTTVDLQRVGNSLSVGTENGIGVTLPGNASPYLVDTGTGTPSMFPFGTNSGIEVVFAPLAEVNPRTHPGGCGIGGESNDPQTGFGLIQGYNVYRVPGTAPVVPTPADFVGDWQYYIAFGDFDSDVVNPGPGLPHPGAGDPDADGDLAGYQNLDGRPYTGDEILIYSDSARNPDGTLRAYGTGPDLSGSTGYWYAFQPVIFSPVPLTAHDGVGYSVSNNFAGDHTMDSDFDLFEESLDLDFDGSADFYSPQAQVGINGLGLTNGGLPLLSPPVFARANPLIAANMRLTGRRATGGIELTLTAGYEDGNILGYDIIRIGNGGRHTTITPETIVAEGGNGSTYRVLDSTLPGSARLVTRLSSTYWVTVHFADRDPRDIGPFHLQVTGPPAAVQRRASR